MSNSDLNSDKKKILDEQERDLEADKALQPLVLTDELEAEGIEMISYSKKYLYIEDYNGHSVHINLFKDSISRTLEYFDSLVDGSFNDSLKKAIKLFIAQAWEDIGTKSKTKPRTKSQSQEEENKDTRPKLYLQRYTDSTFLAEAILIGDNSYFLKVDKGKGKGEEN